VKQVKFKIWEVLHVSKATIAQSVRKVEVKISFMVIKKNEILHRGTCEKPKLNLVKYTSCRVNFETTITDWFWHRFMWLSSDQC